MTDRMKALTKRYGSEEAALAKVKEWAAKGGRAKVDKGFAMNPELAKKMGKLTRKK